MDAFKGFSPQTFQFLQNLKANNYKEWFEENRNIYESDLLIPFKAFVANLIPSMYNIDQAFELRPHRIMSRIYRDVRFSKNKEPYKPCLWASFQIPVAAGEWQHFPGYFFELNANGYFYGLGFYSAKRKTMDVFRDKVALGASEFKKITESQILKRGFSIGGEEYKRPLKNDLSEYFQPWLQKKSIWVSKTKPIGKELYSGAFIEGLVEEFQSLQWLYNFFKECQE